MNPFRRENLIDSILFYAAVAVCMGAVVLVFIALARLLS